MCSAQCGLHDVLRRSSYVEIAHQLRDFGGSCAITEIKLLRRLSNVLHVPRASIGIEMCTWCCDMFMFDVGGPCILASISAHFASRISRKLEAIHDDTHDNRRPHSPGKPTKCRPTDSHTYVASNPRKHRVPQWGWKWNRTLANVSQRRRAPYNTKSQKVRVIKVSQLRIRALRNTY